MSEQPQHELHEQHVPTDHHPGFSRRSLLAEASPVISKMIQRKELIVAGGIYDLGTGVVTAIDLSIG